MRFITKNEGKGVIEGQRECAVKVQRVERVRIPSGKD